jgi:3-hydroxybutyryl-CoA dehydratase
MNEYRLGQISIGLEESFSIQINDQMMDLFLELSADRNPLHLDNEFARENGFVARVVYGMLTSAFYSRLIGVHLPGKYGLLQGVNIAFNKPVYIGDWLQIQGQVAYINETYGQIEVKAQIINQSGAKVSTAKIKVGLNG